ncbi:MAG: hypothetical protein KC944_18275, partial [Candidatus Omnitrophica bacterium]|nr:hypothetical protein [Candidatus Omnitrophota bacterium]
MKKSAARRTFRLLSVTMEPPIRYGKTRLTASILVLIAILPLTSAQAQGGRMRPEGGVWIMVNNLPGANKDVGKEILTYFAAMKGPPTKVVHPAELLHELDPDSIRSDAVLILTDCGTLPLELTDKIAEFLDRGGRVLALGGTLFRNPVRLEREVDRSYAGLEWTTPALHDKEMETVPLDHLLFDWKDPSHREGGRNTNKASHPTVYQFESDPRFETVLHAQIEDLDGWGQWVSPNLKNPPDPSQKFTSFWAKGGPRTKRLAVEWRETDGSRWFATVPLEPKWKRYLLPESAFEFWESIPARKETQLDLSHGQNISFGLALSHTGGLTGDQEFWVADVGTTQGKGVTQFDWDVDFPVRELLYPHYQTYSCTDTQTIVPRREQALLTISGEIETPKEVQAYPARPQSFGWINTNRDHRLVPLLEARSSSGDLRGIVAALRFDEDLESMWAAVSIEDPAFYLQPPMLEFVRDLVLRMMQGDFLWEGGSTQPTYFPGDPIQVGASVCHRNSPYGETFVRNTICEASSGRVIYLRDHPKGKYEISSATAEKIELQIGV